MVKGIGIIGGGRAAQELHLPALARIEGVQVRAIVEPDAPRRTQAMKRFGIPQAYDDYHRLIDDPHIDIVAVLTPPALHAESGTAALAAGKAVMIEKPIALTLDDADRLVAAGVGRRAAVGFNLRFHPQLAAAKAKRALAAIGAPLSVRTIFAGSGGRAGWRGQAGMGGDPLIDLGTHHLDLWRWLFDGEVSAITAMADPGEAAVTVTARLSGGAVASGVFSHNTAGQHIIEINGERGRITSAPYQADGLRVEGLHAPSRPRAAVDAMLIFGALAITLHSAAVAVLMAADKPRWVFALNVPLAPLAFALQWMLVPVWGAVGAAWISTALAIGAAGVMTAAVARVWGVGVPLGSIARAIGLCAAAYAVCAAFPVTGAALLVQIAVVTGLIAAGYRVTGEFTRAERGFAASLVPWRRRASSAE